MTGEGDIMTSVREMRDEIGREYYILRTMREEISSERREVYSIVRTIRGEISSETRREYYIFRTIYCLLLSYLLGSFTVGMNTGIPYFNIEAMERMEREKFLH